MLAFGAEVIACSNLPWLPESSCCYGFLREENFLNCLYDQGNVNEQGGPPHILFGQLDLVRKHARYVFVFRIGRQQKQLSLDQERER